MKNILIIICSLILIGCQSEKATVDRYVQQNKRDSILFEMEMDLLKKQTATTRKMIEFEKKKAIMDSLSGAREIKILDIKLKTLELQLN